MRWLSLLWTNSMMDVFSHQREPLGRRLSEHSENGILTAIIVSASAALIFAFVYAAKADSVIPKPKDPEQGYTATLLPDGKWLIAGGIKHQSSGIERGPDGKSRVWRKVDLVPTLARMIQRRESGRYGSMRTNAPGIRQRCSQTEGLGCWRPVWR